MRTVPVTITLKQAAGEVTGEVEATLEEVVTALEALKGNDDNPSSQWIRLTWPKISTGM